MGVVVSALAAAGPAVLEDLETPYAVLQERKEQEKAREEKRREAKAAKRVKKAIPARRRSPEPLVVRTYTAAVPPTPSHKPKKTLASPRRPPSRERENTPPPRRPSSVTRKSLQRQNSVHSLPSSSPSKNSTERSRSRGSLQMTPASDAGLSSTPAKSPSREAQTSATPVKTPTKERNSVSSRDISPISMTANPTQNDINSPPQVLLVAPKTPSKKRLERGNHVDDPESDSEEPLEKTTNPGVAIAVEEAIKNMFNRVDEATVDPYYYNQIIREEEEEEESWILADSTLPEPAANTYKVSPTKSSKLRKQSARRRIKTLDSLPPSRRDELQAYAGQYLPKSRRSSAKPKKVLHQSEWQP